MDTLKLNSWYMKVAHLWGDEIKTIIEKARDEKQVMIKLLFFNVSYIHRYSSPAGYVICMEETQSQYSRQKLTGTHCPDLRTEAVG